MNIDLVRTERLVLTRIGDADFADLCRMHRDARVMRTLGGVRSDAVSADVLRQLVAHWDAHRFGYWMARAATSGTCVGRGGLRHVIVGGWPEVEIGYALMPDYWRQGYATELARACVCIGFDKLGLDALVAFTLPTNDRSRRVMERVGFTFERAVSWNDAPHVLYRLTAEQWRAPDSTQR
jgi:RimJ/RimL family protein N-acetyltransferase